MRWGLIIDRNFELRQGQTRWSLHRLMFLAQGQEVTDKRNIATLLVANHFLVAKRQFIADRDGTSGRNSSKQGKSFSSEYVY